MVRSREYGARDRCMSMRGSVTRASGRTAIIGAGAAGLAAAHALQQRGQHAVVFERSDRVGGKCRTVSIDGRNHEMGATILFPTFRHVRRLMRYTGTLGSRVRLEGEYVDAGGARTVTVAPARRDTSWSELAAATSRLGSIMMRHRRLLRPGFVGVDPGLCIPFSEWVARNGLAACARYYEPWFTGFGYGYFRDMPAAYVLKYISLVRPLAYDLMDGGFQGLWERVGSTADVRLGADVRRIERDGRVIISTGDGNHEFDHLILACPLDEALAFLDADSDETALFARLRYHRYASTLATVEGPPLARWGFFMDNLAPERRGHPMFWYKRWPDTPIVNFFSLLDSAAGPAETADAIAAALRPIGRGLGAVRGQEIWQRYCPHLTPDEMAAGWFDRVDQIQGRRHTFYTGEALSFGLVETAADHARSVVGRFADRHGATRRDA
jgi:hypothetical protein